VAQHCGVDEWHTTAGGGVTLTLLAVVLMYVILVAPGEILSFISQHLLSRSGTNTSGKPVNLLVL